MKCPEADVEDVVLSQQQESRGMSLDPCHQLGKYIDMGNHATISNLVHVVIRHEGQRA